MTTIVVALFVGALIGYAIGRLSKPSGSETGISEALYKNSASRMLKPFRD